MKKSLVFTFVIAAFITSAVRAEHFPSRPITLIVPVAAGGPTDTIARIVADRMKQTLDQPVVVENITGAAGNIGVAHVAHANPDGYTIGIGLSSTHVMNGAIYKLSYDVLKDFAPIALLTTSPHLIVSKNALPAKDLKELVAWLRANSGKVLEGTAGAGSPPHIAGIYLEKATGANFQFVPYRGGAPIMQALLAGEVDISIPQAFAVHLVHAGKIKAYAVMGPKRLKAAPEIPTVDEAGLPKLYFSTWHGLWAPKNTPKEAIAKLNAAVVDALNDPLVRKRLADLQQQVFSPDMQTPEALSAFQKAEIEKWWPIIKAANIKVQ
ncbi:MAG TPA: tripartite tricarboxylate transporter substrate-binding protein [Pseudolabrys sp.]|nr:tripartite tricarboxylate transporter substrate-binding protein [Pseudolabrys sp.]